MLLNFETNAKSVNFCFVCVCVSPILTPLNPAGVSVNVANKDSTSAHADLSSTMNKDSGDISFSKELQSDSVNNFLASESQSITRSPEFSITVSSVGADTVVNTAVAVISEIPNALSCAKLEHANIEGAAAVEMLQNDSKHDCLPVTSSAVLFDSFVDPGEVQHERTSIQATLGTNISPVSDSTPNIASNVASADIEVTTYYHDYHDLLS